MTGVQTCALPICLRLTCLLTVPCAIGLWFFAEPIISLLYQRHRFTFHDMQQTAAALQFYTIGLVAYSGIKVLAPSFYALDRRHAPMMVSFFSIATNYFLNQFFTFRLGFGHRGLALSVGIVAAINFVILYGMMMRHLRGLETRLLFLTLGKLAVGGAVLALVCRASQTWWLSDLEHMAFLPKLIAVFITIGVAAALFFATAYLLKIDEIHDVTGMIRKKLRRN